MLRSFAPPPTGTGTVRGRSMVHCPPCLAGTSDTCFGGRCRAFGQERPHCRRSRRDRRFPRRRRHHHTTRRSHRPGDVIGPATASGRSCRNACRAGQTPTGRGLHHGDAPLGITRRRPPQQRQHEERWNRRHLHTSTGLDGWVQGDFHLDPIAGAALIGALDHEAPPDPEDSPDGPRTLSQRRADALVDIINRHINGGVTGGNPPNVVAVADVAELTGMSPPLAATRCEMEGIGPVARSVLDQMCCDARFTRLVMSGKSQVLDMGRSVRVATPTQRRALAVRDRRCRFPSCRRRPLQS